MSKKWLFGILIAVILLAGAGGVCVYSVRLCCQHVILNQQARLQAENPVWEDLLSLNISNDLKITRAQAQIILPLAEKLRDSDIKTAADLTRQIYAQLNGQQYLALQRGNGQRKMAGMRQNSMNRYNSTINRGDKGQMMRQAALPDIVIKQLKDLAAQV
jgi:hypothetical protein